MITMLESMDNFIAMAKYRNHEESVKMEKLISMYEQGSKVRFEEFVFRALISIFPEDLKVELNKNLLNVTFHGGVKPMYVNKRKVVLKSLLNELDDENSGFDLV